MSLSFTEILSRKRKMMPDVLRDAQHLAPGFLVSEKTPVPKLNAIGGKKSKEKTGHLGIKG